MGKLLENRDVIIFALPRHDGQYESTSFNIAKELARHNRVIYVDDPYSIKDILINFRKDEIKRRMKHFLPCSSGISEWKDNEISLKTVTLPPTIPINSLSEGFIYSFLQKINTFFIGTRLKRVIGKLDLKHIVFINSFDFYYPHLEKYILPSIYIYHCIDGMIKPYTLKHGPRLESQIVKAADAVISTSPELQRKKSADNPRSYLIPNAANFQHSSKALLPETPIAAELEKYPSPIIGYFGNIERRIDYNILKYVALKQPTWSFVMVGPVEQMYIPDEINSIPNIYFVGRQPYHRLPEFLKGFDVAIVPFKIDEISRTIYPLKLYEYLGAGKPVVSTCFNPDVLQNIDGVIFLADTPGLFAEAIFNALDSNNDRNIEKRLEIARNNTWRKRGAEFSELVESLVSNSEKL